MSRSCPKSALSPSCQRLVELMQEINFGRLEMLHVRNGEPVFNPSPRIVREIKFASENGPRPERTAGDFELKAQVAELFRYLKELSDGTVESLEVKHGLPFLMRVASG